MITPSILSQILNIYQHEQTEHIISFGIRHFILDNLHNLTNKRLELIPRYFAIAIQIQFLENFRNIIICWLDHMKRCSKFGQQHAKLMKFYETGFIKVEMFEGIFQGVSGFYLEGAFGLGFLFFWAFILHLFIQLYIKGKSVNAGYHSIKKHKISSKQQNIQKYKSQKRKSPPNSKSLMFEASFLNGIDIRCCEHIRNPVTLLCTDYKCNENPYLCNQCRVGQKHYGHDLKLKEIMPAVRELSESLARCRKPIESMYSQICSDKQNDNFMKYQQERQQHCQSIRKHIESIKFQIEEQIGNIVKAFEREVEKEKMVMFTELEKYYENYRDKFDYLSRKIGPIASINNIFKYYNKSNILLRLMADSDPGSSIRWFNDLKKAVKAGQVLSTDPTAQVQKIKNLSSATNQLMDKLPRVRSSEYETQLPRMLNSSAKECLRQFVKFGEIKHYPSMGSLSSISRSYSMQGENGHLYRNNSYQLH